MRVLFVVSTLKHSGPTNQLLNIISNLDRNAFEPHLITLSPEPKYNSRWKDYESAGVNLYSLNLSRIKGLFLASSTLKNFIKEINPDLIHTQGIRADSLASSIAGGIPWVMTSRNFPPEDYISKFGRIKGTLMVKQHFAAMKKCRHLVSCSKTIQAQLKDVGIESDAIQNGVKGFVESSDTPTVLQEYKKPIYISVGSLIPRKNMGLLVDAFQQLPNESAGSLIILGDGPLKNELQAKAGSNVGLLGNVSNVHEYLSASDYFVSTSLSEGLPNTVLEALSAGLPVVLSDIDSHKEIAHESELACQLFSLSSGELELKTKLSKAPNDFNENSRVEANRIAREVFSAKQMSEKYQKLYRRILEVS
nr:glycosyltransferase [uncultured Vibrio sp.]